MSIKTLLVPLDSNQDAAAALSAAFLMAKRFSAHVDALYVRSDPKTMLPYATIGLLPDMRRNIVESFTRSIDAAATAARKTFDEVRRRHKVAEADAPAAKGGASAAWCESVGRESSLVALRGRLADLIVLPRPLRPSPAPESLEVALLETGRGVLIVPPKSAARIGNHVAVAWNGAKEVAASVLAGLPLLSDAKKVTVLSAAERKKTSDLSAQDFIAYLAWHGIKATDRPFNPGSRDIGKAILAEAKSCGADLLIMGAYGHSRERELILGGATREVLASADIPVLMAH